MIAWQQEVDDNRKIIRRNVKSKTFLGFTMDRIDKFCLEWKLRKSLGPLFGQLCNGFFHLWQFQPFFSQRFFQAHSLHRRLYFLGASWGFDCVPSSASTLPIFHIKPEYSKLRKKRKVCRLCLEDMKTSLGFFSSSFFFFTGRLRIILPPEEKGFIHVPPCVCFCFMWSKNRAAGIRKAKEGGNDSPLLYEHHDKHIPPYKWVCKLEHEVKLCFSIDRVAFWSNTRLLLHPNLHDMWSTLDERLLKSDFKAEKILVEFV